LGFESEEEEGPVHVDQAAGAGSARAETWTAGARIDVRDEDRSPCRPVRLPELMAHEWVQCAEEDGAVDVREAARRRTRGAWVDVLHENGPRLRAVALPQLLTVDRVEGGEEERAVHIRQGSRIRPVGSRIDVLHQH